MPTHTVHGGFPEPGLSIYRVRWYRSAVAARAVIVPSSPPVVQYTNGAAVATIIAAPTAYQRPTYIRANLYAIDDRYDPKHHR